MAIEFHKSAAKHGYTRADALAAIANATHGNTSFDRRGTDYETRAWVGPTDDGTVLEVFAMIIPPDRVVIVHCMEVRAKTMQRLRRIQ